MIKVEKPVSAQPVPGKTVSYQPGEVITYLSSEQEVALINAGLASPFTGEITHHGARAFPVPSPAAAPMPSLDPGDYAIN